MSRDTNDGPRATRFVWAILGLLAFPWLMATGVWVRLVWRDPPDTFGIWVFSVVAWVFVVGPQLLFGLAAWFGRSDPVLVGVCFIYGILSAVGMLVLVATAVAGEVPGGLGVGMCLFWVIGWSVGTLAFTFSHRDG